MNALINILTLFREVERKDVTDVLDMHIFITQVGDIQC